LKIIDIGGGFPVPYDAQVPEFAKLANIINAECERLFPSDVEIIAEPGRFFIISMTGFIIPFRA
jgi:ornithine decarboxylase